MKTKKRIKDQELENVVGGVADGPEKNMWVGGGAGVSLASLVTEQEAQAVEKMTSAIQEKHDKWLK